MNYQESPIWRNSANLQLDSKGRLRHFLTIEGLSKRIITEILDTAESFSVLPEQSVKKVPLLRGKTIANLFFEASTRTRTTFEVAAKRLSADVLTINVSTSSAIKGESLLDTLHNLEAMHIDMFVVRHSQSGAANFIASHASPHVSIVNGGDGRHAHPTQALLDMFTIRRHKPDFSVLKVAIVGDVMHSRVARSQIHALRLLGVPEIRVIAPRTLLPKHIREMGARVFSDLHTGLCDVDVVMMLRLQRERMESAMLPSGLEFFQVYGLTSNKLALAKPDALVMHPGPINRGVEMSSEVADGAQSVILQQVTHGIAIRMAVMSLCLGNHYATGREERLSEET